MIYFMCLCICGLIFYIIVFLICFGWQFAELKCQLLHIDGKTEDEVFRSLERVLVTIRITNSKAKVRSTLILHILFRV